MKKSDIKDLIYNGHITFGGLKDSLERYPSDSRPSKLNKSFTRSQFKEIFLASIKGREDAEVVKGFKWDRKMTKDGLMALNIMRECG